MAAHIRDIIDWRAEFDTAARIGNIIIQLNDIRPTNALVNLLLGGVCHNIMSNFLFLVDSLHSLLASSLLQLPFQS